MNAKRFWAIKRLIREFYPYRKKIAVVLALGFLISSIQPLSLKLSQRIIDELQAGQNDLFFKWLPLALVGIFMMNGFSKYFYMALRRYVNEKVIIKLRTDLFEKHLWMPQASLDRIRAGDFLANLQNDLSQISVGVDTLADLFKEPLIFLGLIGVAFYWDWQLTLYILVVAPLVVILFSQSGAAVKRYSKRNLESFADLISLSQESIAGSRVVKVFQLERPLLAKFKELHDRFFATVWKSIKVQELATPGVEFVGACLMAAVILYGRYRISNGWLTTGELIAFIIALGLAQMPIKQMNNAYLKLKNAEAAAERVFGILDAPNPLSAHLGRLRKDSFESAIEFNQVGLHYGETRALGNISFKVTRGQRVAFVGPSGGGKSSIINLLPRLYEISEGSIKIDGVELRDIFLHDLRGLISFVTQDTFLFHDSIYENIRFGRPDATRAQVERAADLAHCLSFISKTPKGFETRIGDRGMMLSGGERQRIAIARAILRGAPILVLDEATSNLDSDSEKQVQEALDTLMAGKTTFLVAHRLSTVRKADQIFVVESGRIAHSGAHEKLMEISELYSRFFERQTGVLL